MPIWKKFGILAVTVCAICITAQPQSVSEKHDSKSNRAQPSSYSENPCYWNSCNEEPPDQGAKAHHWYAFLGDSNWWVVIVAALTGLAVASQAIHTRRAADVALAQLRSATSRDRAVLKVQPKGMGVIDDIHRDYWFLESEIGLRNVGIGRAYILNGKASVRMRFARETPKLRDFVTDNLSIVDGFIAANTPPESPHVEKLIYLVQHFSIAEQANSIFPGKVVPYITGFVEYETLGAVFRRNFHYSWKSRGRDGEMGFQMYRALHSLYPNTPPSDQERICAGEWVKEADGNEEYEIRPQSPPGIWSRIRSFLNELAIEDLEDQGPNTN